MKRQWVEIILIVALTVGAFYALYLVTAPPSPGPRPLVVNLQRQADCESGRNPLSPYSGTVDEMLDMSQVVVYGEVVQIFPEYRIPDAGGGSGLMRYRDSKLRVLKTYKGEVSQTIRVAQPGGHLPTKTAPVIFDFANPGNPPFVLGDRHVLFLTRFGDSSSSAQPVYQLLDLAGRYDIRNGIPVCIRSDYAYYGRPTSLLELEDRIAHGDLRMPQPPPPPISNLWTWMLPKPTPTMVGPDLFRRQVRPYPPPVVRTYYPAPATTTTPILKP